MSLQPNKVKKIIYALLSAIFYAAFLYYFIDSVRKWESNKFIDINYGLVLASFVVLYMTFLIQGLIWHFSTASQVSHPNLKFSLFSHLFTIFGKYLPGKIWMVTGRATILAKMHKADLHSILVISGSNQILSLLVGAILSLFFYYNYGGNGDEYHKLVYVVLVITGVLFLLLGYQYMRGEFRPFSFNFLVALFLMVVMWAGIGIGFYLFADALSAERISFLFAPVFIGSTILGIAAFFSPGGVGVREAGLVAGLVMLGARYEEAVALSVVSRIWFVSGEAMGFVTALILKAILHKNGFADN